MNEIAVEFKKVNKVYKLYKNEKQRFVSIFFKNINHTKKVANDDVSFKISKGESVAIIGKNGAGKSTMLKMITGVVYPTAGEIIVNGRVSALLELTAGFDPELTGRENIYFKGQIMGFTKKEMDKVIDEIIEFSEIGEYIDQPVRTYSSGMRARLGFAVSANVDPEIFIIDEALSVGDASFSQKCKAKITEIKEKKDLTFLFVTHNINAAKIFCSRGIFVRDGKVIFDGSIDDATEEYAKTI